MNTVRRPQADPATPSPGPVSPAEDQQAREAELRRFSLRDRLLQMLEWVYPYAPNRIRHRRHK